MNFETEPTHLLNKRVILHQPQAGLRAGMDGVVLSAFVPVRAGQHVLDLGCATGAVGLCVLARNDAADIQLTGVDILPELTSIAAQNADANGWAERCHFVAGDVRDAALVPCDGFDHVVMNPPYQSHGTWTMPRSAARQKAMGAGPGDAPLSDWMLAARRWCKPKGSVTTILPAEQLPDILSALKTGFGGVEVWPVYPRATEPALRVIVRAVKGRRAGFTLHQGITLHKAEGAWTPQAQTYLS